MILEYLVKGEANADICISIIEQTSAAPEKKQLKADTYIVTAYLKNDSDSSAITLSKIHEDIVAAVDCIVLTDESSAYYDRVLFPLINQFERKLRKLLYSASVISADQGNHIVDLESKDFGELFTLLFRDEDYWKTVKTYVNGQKRGQKLGWQGFAGELKIFLNGENEKPLWDKLLPGEVPTLRESFSDVQQHRNDVMHAHYIMRKEYLQIRRLFEQINSEIDEAIEGLANGALIPSTYNEDLGNAMAYFTTHEGEYVTDHEGNRLIFR